MKKKYSIDVVDKEWFQGKELFTVCVYRWILFGLIPIRVVTYFNNDLDKTLSYAKYYVDENGEYKKNNKNMKNWTWKQWTSLGLVVAVFITCLVLHLVQPQITYSFAELMTFVGAVVGFVAGYLFKRDIKQN